MPKPFESNLEIKLGEQTLCVFAMWRREDGSHALVGMRDIVDGEFVSRKMFAPVMPENDTVDVGGEKAQEVSRLHANGGELFVINHVDLKDSAEELREIFLQVAGRKIEPNSHKD